MDVAARLRERELASIRVQAENGLRESALNPDLSSGLMAGAEGRLGPVCDHDFSVGI